MEYRRRVGGFFLFITWKILSLLQLKVKAEREKTPKIKKRACSLIRCSIGKCIGRWVSNQNFVLFLGTRRESVEDEKTEYAEIKPQN